MGSPILEGQEIDLNRASEGELAQLSVLGPELARRIVDERPLQSWEDLRKLEGFNDEIVDELVLAGATLGPAGRA